MITNLKIQNYKSIIDLNIELRLINVFIGENGVGKSTILNSLNTELIHTHFKSRKNNNKAFIEPQIPDYVVYEPNILVLKEGITKSNIKPLGKYGESLIELLSSFTDEQLNKLNSYSYFWKGREGIKIKIENNKVFFINNWLLNKEVELKDLNDGFLFTLFYLVLFISDKTPKIFGIDNFGNCLNPHLNRFLFVELITLAIENDKQVLITTEQPTILDSLNLHDDKIRLFEVQSARLNYTETRRIKLKPEHEEQGRRLKLSELWTRGFLGGISQDY
jgi:AAA15 family ATPase/GTPase